MDTDDSMSTSHRLYEIILHHHIHQMRHEAAISRAVTEATDTIFRLYMSGEGARQGPSIHAHQTYESLKEYLHLAEEEFRVAESNVDSARKLIEAHPTVLMTRISSFASLCMRFRTIDEEGTAKLIHCFCSNLDEDDPLPIHIATCLGCNPIVDLILEKHPSSAMAPFQKDLPIHISAREGYNDISILLLEKSPACAFVKGNGGVLPLCSAAGNSSTKVLHDLLIVNPLAARLSVDFDLLPVNVAVNKGKVHNALVILKMSGFYGLFNTYSDPWDIIYFNEDLNDIRPCWEKNNAPWDWIVELYGRDNIPTIFPGIEEYPILLDAIGKAKLADIRYIMDTLTNDISREDEFGETAMTIAIHGASEDRHRVHWASYFYPIVKCIFQRLVDTDETARDENGSNTNHRNRRLLPIVIKEGLPWFGVKDVLYDDIESLNAMDSETGLFPFMLSCAKESKADLTTCFEVLRMKPDIVNTTNEAL